MNIIECCEMPAPKDPVKREEWIRKNRESHTGERNSNFGKHRSEETKEKIRKNHKFIIIPQSQRDQASQQMKLLWQNPEYRERQVAAHKLLVVPEERRIHIGNSVKKIWKTPDGRQKLLANRKECPTKGKKRPKEFCEKMHLTHIGKFRGAESSHWKGGISFEPYCPKFNNEFKERVRAFFNYTCQLCGHIWQEGEMKLAVHHVNFNKQTCCDSSQPLFVPLCTGKCHSKTNYHRDFWEDWFTEIINEFYNGKCYFTKDEMIE